jgi:hypothetical protein
MKPQQDRSKFGYRLVRTILSTIILASSIATIDIPTARSQPVGTSCEDCANYKGAFSIENSTGITIIYQMRWGKNNQWKTFSLASGRVMKHSYPLGESSSNKAPQPYVIFSQLVSGQSNTPVLPAFYSFVKEYTIRFRAVGYAGYGAPSNNNQPKAYYFKLNDDRKLVDLKLS